ncbi:MAG: hypothetical protein AB1401_10360 [Thermodesulfobacteriota bacterium]
MPFVTLRNVLKTLEHAILNDTRIVFMAFWYFLVLEIICEYNRIGVMDETRE